MSQTMNWNDVDKNVKGTKRFKPEAGKTFRIKLMANNPEVEFAQYVEGLGFIKTFSKVEVKKGAMLITEPGLDVELLNKDPQLMFHLPIAVYLGADSETGQLKKGQKSEIEYQIWSFYGTDAKKLATVAGEWDDLTKVDLLIKGEKKGKWVNSTVTPSKLCGADWLEDLIPDFAFTPYAKDITKFMAREVSEDDFKEAVAKLNTQDKKNPN